MASKMVDKFWLKFQQNSEGKLDRDQAKAAIKLLIWQLGNGLKFSLPGFNQCFESQEDSTVSKEQLASLAIRVGKFRLNESTKSAS